MSLPLQPEVILTHESDLDGLLAALLAQRLAKHWYNAEIPTLAYHTHGWRQRQPFESSAWVCDLAYEPKLDRSHWIIFDHHPFSCTPPQLAQLHHNPQTSAASIVYQLLKENGLANETLDQIVHLNNVSDLFLVDDPAFLTAIDHASLVKTYGFWNLYRLINGEPEKLLNHPLLQVTQLKREIEDPLGLDWSRQHITPLPGNIGIVETTIGNPNLVVHHLLNETNCPYTVLLNLYRKGSGNFLVSLRSRNGEALAIAEKLKGGGHPNASGASLPRSIQSLAEAIQYLKKVLAPTSVNNTNTTGVHGLFESAGL
jgi:hypothetical protein